MLATRKKVEITVDESLCTRCRSCEKSCPSGVFSWNYAGLDVHHPGRCIGCGHCVAACAQGALSHSELPTDKFEERDEASRLSPEQLDQLFRNRRSRRRFTSDSLERGQVEDVLDAARYAPTSTNSQNVRFLVFDTPKKVLKLSEWTSRYYLKLGKQLANPFIRLMISMAVGRKTVNAYKFRMPAIVEMFEKTLAGEEDRLFYGAPCVAVLFASGLPHLASASCNLAAMQILLAADAHRLGGFFNGYALTALVRDKKVRELVGIDKGYTPGAVIALGKPVGKFHRIPPRNKRRIIWHGDQ